MTAGVGEVTQPTSRALLCVALVLAASFALGGSARPEVASLAPLRLILIALLCLGVAALSLDQLKSARLPLAIAAAITLIPAAQLVPLPPGVANALPGHAVVAEIDGILGASQIWRPLSLAPWATWNALLAVVSVGAALIWAIQVPREAQRHLLGLTLCVGSVSVIIGLLQTLGPATGPLYLYETTNNGSAVGLFANRNHQAAFLATLVPVAFALGQVTPRGSRRSGFSWPRGFASPTLAALAFTAVLVPMITITGSRAGLALMLVGLGSIPFIASRGRRAEASGAPRPAAKLFAAVLLLASLLLALAIWLQRSLAVDRLLDASPADEMRLLIIPTLKGMIQDFWPLGSGLGSFERLYQLYEPADLLRPFYMNHAHNDWLETVMTGGAPAALLLALCTAAWGVQFVRVTLQREPDAFEPIRKAGLTVTLLLGLASISDYPLRTPALGVLFAIATVWASLPRRAAATETRHHDAGRPKPHFDFQTTTPQGSQPK